LLVAQPTCNSQKTVIDSNSLRRANKPKLTTTLEDISNEKT
jgi:hypothetical protein